MSKIVIGKHGHENVAIDIETLLATRLLVTADSGGGKTVALKRIIEQAFDKIRIIVIDPEGEFAPMREKFNFVLATAGKGGETEIHPRSASLLALRLRELHASAICDISEMKPSLRHEWVRLFLESLIESPKSLRKPCLVIVDEAHMFCPEKGMGESDATDAMVALCSRGRKRMLCAIFATQRLSALSKSATGMLTNRLVGPTFDHLNRNRAALELSVPKEEKNKFFQVLQMLEPGNFMGQGRAISRERILVKIGSITTPHGQEAVKYALEPPPAPEQIKALLPKLADLPKTAEEKARTEAEFRKEISNLKAQLRMRSAETKEVRIVDHRAIERAVRDAIAPLARNKMYVSATVNLIRKSCAQMISEADALIAKFVDAQVSAGESKKGRLLKTLPPHTPRPMLSTFYQPGDTDLTGPQSKILKALSELGSIGIERPRRSMVASWYGAKAGTGTFKNYLSELRTKGLIVTQGDTVQLTSEGIEKAPAVETPATQDELLKRVKQVLGGPVGNILAIVHREQGEFMSRDTIAQELGVSADTGTFKNYISELRTAGMIEDGPDKQIKAADWLYI